jgi:aminoglycoside phosphotransferase (APT) family kinase protein
MIPEAKQHAVRRALHEAFGVNEPEELHLLSGGLSSARAFRIVVRKNPYLLKILRTEIISDPANEFACQQAAAEAGISPRIWYASVEDRILITDYVEAKPFPDDMGLRMAATIRRLHSLPGFPSPKMGNYFDAMNNGFVRRFQAAQLMPESATEELFRRYEEVLRVYPRNETEMVSSHNDLKPQNMRFDGERIWLVDWESAFLNDRYADLAVVANFFVNDEADEEAYLNAYFGEPDGDIIPSWEYIRARFFLMRQAVSMFYASLLFLEAARAGLSIDANMTIPDFRDYHRDLIADKVDMLTAEAKAQYGMVHLREALRNMRTQRFEEAVARVGDFHVGA